MPSRRRRFQRPLGKRRYRKLFVIATEGEKTEPQYFALFNDQNALVKVNCLKSRHDNSPSRVLNRMKEYLRKEALRTSDEAWLVVDKDCWTEEQLAELHAWAATKENYGFALSNPQFEYWLLLHFEHGNNIRSARDCLDRLKQHLPEYKKEFPAPCFTPERIDQAVQRAKQRDQPPCVDWPRNIGSTIYRLVEQIRKNATLD
jgi:hypothetical protein